MKLFSDLIYGKCKSVLDTYKWRSNDGKHVLIAECVYWDDDKRQDQFKIIQLFENEIVAGELLNFRTHYIDSVDKWLKTFDDEKIEMTLF